MDYDHVMDSSDLEIQLADMIEEEEKPLVEMPWYEKNYEDGDFENPPELPEVHVLEFEQTDHIAFRPKAIDLAPERTRQRKKRRGGRGTRIR